MLKNWVRTLIQAFCIIVVLISGFLSVAGFMTKQYLEHVNYDYTSEKIPPEMDGFKLVQITDVHNHSLEYENGNLIDQIKAINPDVLMYTGDLIDQHSGPENIKNYHQLFEAFKEVPAFMVGGNHETYARYQEEFRDLVSQYPNITVLRDTSTTFTYHGYTFNISGIHDVIEEDGDKTGFFSTKGDELIEPFVALAKASADSNNNFNLLLSHRPDHLKVFAKYNFDLVLSGHTHGGQIGFFPMNFEYKLSGQHRYITGKFTMDNTTLLVSNGLGFSGKLPVRVKCPMQLLTVTFKAN